MKNILVTKYEIPESLVCLYVVISVKGFEVVDQHRGCCILNYSESAAAVEKDT